MSRPLQDKVIVIAGASAGIGAATAEACAAAGMDVVLAARRRDKLQQVAARIAARGRRAVTVACDVCHDADVARLMEHAMGELGRIDAVFANAGYGLRASVLQMTDAQHRDIFEANYFGTVRTLQAAAEPMRQTEAGLRHMLVCSSAASEVALPYFGAYAATKAAQDAIAGSLRAELAAEGFAVTTVHPVGTRTEFFKVASEISGTRCHEKTLNTPPFLAQSSEAVAGKILAALRRPRPEVWPRGFVRYGLALLTAWPSLAARVMRKQALKRQADGENAP